MTASARTLSLEETLLEPPALPPPPTRHALLVILIALAALLHVVTIGTGDLYSETEGQYAGAAREMAASHNWLLPTNNGIPRLQKPPLDKRCRVNLWSGRRRPSKSKSQRTKLADAAGADNRILHREVRPR